MSNALVITVTEFKNMVTNEVSYGFTAFDSYGQLVENHCDSVEELLEEFPTEDDLIKHVLEDNAFQEAAIFAEDGSYKLDACSGVIVYGYPNEP